MNLQRDGKTQTLLVLLPCCFGSWATSFSITSGGFNLLNPTDQQTGHYKLTKNVQSHRIWGNGSKHTRHPEYFIWYGAAMTAIKFSTLNLQRERERGGGDMGLNGSIFHSIKTQKSSTFEAELDNVFDVRLKNNNRLI